MYRAIPAARRKQYISLEIEICRAKCEICKAKCELQRAREAYEIFVWKLRYAEQRVKYADQAKCEIRKAKQEICRAKCELQRCEI